jgi:hypothetical protein
MLDCGLRWEEAAGQHGFRVDLLRKKLHVREVAVRGRRIKLEPKTEASERDVPLTDDLVTDLAWLMGDPRPRRAPVRLVGVDGTERPLDYTNWLRRVWNPRSPPPAWASPSRRRTTAGTPTARRSPRKGSRRTRSWR